MTGFGRRELIRRVAILGTVPFAGCSYTSSENNETRSNSTSKGNNSEPAISEVQTRHTLTTTQATNERVTGIDLRISNVTGIKIQGSVSIYRIVDSTESELIFERPFTISNGTSTTYNHAFAVDESIVNNYDVKIKFDDGQTENFSISFLEPPESLLVDVDIFEDSIEYNRILS